MTVTSCKVSGSMFSHDQTCNLKLANLLMILFSRQYHTSEVLYPHAG